MKQSGIDWIGEIPDDWKTRQIRYLFSLRDERNYKPLSEVNLISVYTDKGVLQHSDIEQTTGNKAQNAEGYKHVYKNDLVVNIILCWMGALGISDYDGVTSPAYDVYAPKDLNTILPKYYHYLFRTPQFNGKCYTEGRGIMQMRWRTYSSEFKSIKVPLPPKATQQRIAEYLDKKVSEIDSIIEESKKSIEEYKAWKQAVIFEAVTGKNMTCKKKASGIEWIGEIPDIWTCTKLKYYIQIKSGDAIRNEELTDIGLYQVFGGGECIGMTNRYNADSSNILIGRVGARCGCITKPNDKVWATDNALIVSSNMNRDFLTYCLQAVNLNELNNSNAQPLITGTKVKNTFIPIPDNPEQKKIVKFLDSKFAQIDSLIAEKELLITDLTEYKKSLIFEVVTGKRSV